MKKLLLFLLVCISAVRVEAVSVNISATGASGSYTTGYATSSSRNDGSMISTSTTTRGYAVFNLGSLPTGAVITSAIIHFYVSAYSGSGVPSGWQTYGYAGDLSTVTTASMLFADMVAGTLLSTATYGTTGGAVALASTTASTSFLSSQIGNKISICWTGGGIGNYTMTGETGTVGATTLFAPYLEITYCVGPTGVSATASPTSVCPGSKIKLTGAASGATSYSWTGPGSYTSTNQSDSFIAASTSGGVYTFAATSAGCTYSVTTTAVTMLAAPAAITPTTPTSVCVGSTTTLADATTGGIWSSSSAGFTTVTPTGGVVTGVAQGVDTITYTLSTGCFVSKTVTVNAAPAAIVPATAHVCLNSTTTLTNSSTGGTWTSSLGSIASINATTGVVTGNGLGTVNITYNNGCGTAATSLVTVDPLPANITGTGTVCPGSTITLADATPGGTWSSGAPLVATVGSSTGIVTAIAPSSTATITYTSPLNCNATTVVSTNPVPGPSTGVLKECMGTTTPALTNALAGGTWSSSAPTVASIDASGKITGVNAGTVYITYTTMCAFSTVIDTVVGIPPDFVGGNIMCVGADHALADSVIGGTWSSSNTSVATIGLSTGVMHGNAVGYTVITYTIPPGCITSDTVTVLALPPAITGSTQTCPGQTTALHNASPHGSWMSLSPGVASVNSSGVVSGLSSDTARIVYADTNGCKISTIVTVNPNPLPIVGKNLLCATLMDTLSNASIGGVWSSTTPGIATVDAVSGIVTTVSGGVATIRYTYATTGCYAQKLITVDPLPVPVVTFNYFTASFEATTGFVSYQWYNSVQGLVPGATYSTTAAIYEGYYYVVVTDTNGCMGASASVPFSESMLGVNTANKVSCRVYPNPAEDVINIDAPIRVRAVISDMTGKKEIETNDAKVINISKLAQGMHVLSLYNDNGQLISVQKLTKE